MYIHTVYVQQVLLHKKYYSLFTYQENFVITLSPSLS